MQDKLGATRYQWLLERKQEIKRYRAQDKKAMREHYKNELALLLSRRRRGEVGALPVASYD
jgi:hypothetical protein